MIPFKLWLQLLRTQSIPSGAELKKAQTGRGQADIYFFPARTPAPAPRLSRSQAAALHCQSLFSSQLPFARVPSYFTPPATHPLSFLLHSFPPVLFSPFLLSNPFSKALTSKVHRALLHLEGKISFFDNLTLIQSAFLESLLFVFTMINISLGTNNKGVEKRGKKGLTKDEALTPLKQFMCA